MKMRALYWPGMHRRKHELCQLIIALTDVGIGVDVFGASYDTGPSPDETGSPIHAWLLEHSVRRRWDWWIGLSLGASVAHIVACTIPERIRPSYLTLINPFADRMELSKRNGFDLDGQWPLIPMHFCNDYASAQIVLSLQDDRVPYHHGCRLAQCYLPTMVSVLKMETNHEISDMAVQQMLAREMVLWKESR